MSDGYRSGRDQDQSSYGEDPGRRRELSGRDRWSARSGDGAERRSFEDDEGYGYGYRYGQRTYGPVGYGRAPERGLGPSYGDARGRGYGEAYGRAGIVGGNPYVDRVAAGDFEPGVYERFGGERDERRTGEHRGRGPKNYKRSDDRIREDVSDRLADDAWLDASEIEVAVKDGEVTLNGAVQTREDKRRAENLAEDVSGVKHVQVNLRVQPPAGRETAAQARL